MKILQRSTTQLPVLPGADASTSNTPPVFDDARRRLGAALLDATILWPQWVHRRVDSVQSFVGENGRRKQSIDCTPRDDPRLAYNWEERSKPDVSATRGAVMVPLMYIVKGPLRSFDASRADGAAMPILGTRETVECGVAMISRLLEVEQIAMTESLNKALCEIVGPQVTSSDAPSIRAFLTSGFWDGQRVIDPRHLQKTALGQLIETLAGAFILIGLVDPRDTARRQVLKIAYHWHIPADGLPWTNAFLIAVGLRTRRLFLLPDAASATRSYHLEVHTPPEAECEGLELPEVDRNGPGVDTSRKPLAHAYSSYEKDPASDAQVIFRLPFAGLRGVALGVSAFSFVVVLLALTLVDAKGVWRAAPDGPATVLLVAPALFFTFLASRGESALFHRPLTVLRAMIGLSALSLFLVAASIVGGLEDPFLDILWWTVFAYNAVCAALLISGIIGPAWSDWCNAGESRSSSMSDSGGTLSEGGDG